MRQMHNYVSLNEANSLSMNLPTDDHDYKSDKMKEGEMSVEALQRRREQDLSGISYK
jgi:hypothetical protein